MSKALNFSWAAHRGQFRDDGTRYIVHPIRVETIIRDTGYDDENVRAAALLHDVMEDCGVSGDELVDTFNKEVAILVERVSHLPKQMPNKQFMEQVESYGEHALIIKFADRIDNLRDCVHTSKEKRERYIRATKELYYPLILKWDILQWGFSYTLKSLVLDLEAEL